MKILKKLLPKLRRRKADLKPLESPRNQKNNIGRRPRRLRVKRKR